MSIVSTAVPRTATSRVLSRPQPTILLMWSPMPPVHGRHRHAMPATPNQSNEEGQGKRHARVH